MKKDEKKMEYITPMVEIVEVIVERGFASSPLSDDEGDGTGGTTGGGLWG